MKQGPGPQFNLWLETIFQYYGRKAPQPLVVGVYWEALGHLPQERLDEAFRTYVTNPNASTTSPPKAHEILAVMNATHSAARRPHVKTQETPDDEHNRRRVFAATTMRLHGYDQLYQKLPPDLQAHVERAMAHYVREYMPSEFEGGPLASPPTDYVTKEIAEIAVRYYLSAQAMTTGEQP